MELLSRAVPITARAPFLPKLAGIAEGSLAFVVGLMVLLMLLRVGYQPVVLPLLLEGVSVNPTRIARPLVILMLLPLGATLLLEARFSRVADVIRAPLNRTSSLSLIIVIALLLITNVRNVMALFDTRGIVASALFLLAVTAISWFLGGPNCETKGVLSLGTAQRNIAAGLVVAG